MAFVLYFGLIASIAVAGSRTATLVNSGFFAAYPVAPEGTAQGTISWTFNSDYTKVSLVQVTGNSGSAEYSGGTVNTIDFDAYIYPTTGDGVPATTGTPIIDVGTRNETKSLTDVLITPGQWYCVSTRFRNGTNNFVYQTEQSYFQAGPGGPGADRKLDVFFKNEKLYPVKYVLTNSTGDIKYQVTLNPGQSLGITLVFGPSENIDGLTWNYFTQMLFGDGVGWAQQDGDPNTPAGSEPATVPTSATTPPAQSPGGPTKGPAEGARNESNSSSNSAWSQNNANTATTSGNALDKVTFREGIDKIEKALKGGSSTTGGSGVDPRPNIDQVKASVNAVKTSTDAVKTSVDGVKTAIDALKTNSDKLKTDKQEQIDAIPTDAARNTAATAAKGSTDGVFAVADFSVNSSTASTSAPTFTVSLPSSMGGATYDLNPFTSSRFGPICAWVKSAISWLFLAFYAAYVVGILKEMGIGIGSLRQATGNTIAGTGGQVTALINAGLMTAAIVVALGALLGFITSSIGLGSIASLFTSNPYGGLPGGVAYMIDQVFPVSAAVLLVTGRLVTGLLAAKIYTGLAALIRFFVA